MFKLVNVLMVCLFMSNANSQNLLSNGDFENYSTLPTDITQWSLCTGWTNCGGTGTPDYFNTNAVGAANLPNTNFGFVQPYSGNGIMGFATYGGNMQPEYREYISTQFSSPMVVGTQYQISFYLTNGISGMNDVYSSNRIGINFSTSPLTQTGYAPFNTTPQLEIVGDVWTNSWQQYTFTFTADQAYTYITFGNFDNDAGTSKTYHNTGGMDSYAYYYIDKAEVIGIVSNPVVVISGDTTICSGNTAPIYFTGTPNAIVTYTVDGGANQTIQLDANGSASLTSPSLPINSIYSLVSVALSQAPFTSQTVIGSATITIENPPVVSFTQDVTSGCNPLKVTFTNTSQNSVNCSWDFGDQMSATGCSTVTHTYTTDGVYTVALNTISAAGCSASLSVPDLITVKESPKASFNTSSDEQSSMSESTTFINGSTGAVSYLWDFGDDENSIEVSPNHNYTVTDQSSFIITLVAYGQNGCTDTVQHEIKVNELVFYIPNAFTPDDNNFNQTFQPVFTSGFDAKDFQLMIFNRWGEKIFESKDCAEGWDGQYKGKIQSDGIYTWHVVFKVSATDEKKLVTGHVNLIR